MSRAAIKLCGAIVVCAVLSACATTYFQPMSWAKVSIQQAEAECRYEVQANPMVSFVVCMDRKGWRAVD